MLNPISSIPPVARIDKSVGNGPASGPGFSGTFQEALAEVQKSGAAATESIQKMLSGESEEIHQTMLAVQRAELAFDMFLQVRNKVVQAYQEIMRMQV